MLDYSVKLVLFFIVVCSSVQGISGMEGSLCYLKKNNEKTSLCIPVRMDNCSSDYINITSVMVYVISTCTRPAECGSGKNCCAPGNVTPTPDPNSIIWQCTTTQCLYDITIFILPEIGYIFHLIEFTFKCVNDHSLLSTTTTTTTRHTTGTQKGPSTSVTTALPTHPTINSSTTITTSTTNAIGSTNVSGNFQDDTKSGNSKTGVYVAVPVVLVLLASALIAVIFLWRRRRQKSKQTQNADSKDYFTTSAQNENRKKHNEGDSVSDESGFGDYSEINSEHIGESMKSDQAVDTEYNTLNLRDIPTHSDPNYGFLAAKNSSADETYSRIQDEKPEETDNMYSHIGGAAKNISDDVILDHTYNTAVIPKLENGVINEDEDTYNHLDADMNEKIRDKDKVGESDYSYSKFNSQIENKSEKTDEPVRHDYFVLEKEF